jgi:DNA-binding NtrC family response regulator
LQALGRHGWPGNVRELEHQLLAFAVARESGNLSAAARRLGITRPQLAYRLRRGPMPSEPGAA